MPMKRYNPEQIVTVLRQIEQWRQQYNRIRLHAALGYRPPASGAYTPGWKPVPQPQVMM